MSTVMLKHNNTLYNGNQNHSQNWKKQDGADWTWRSFCCFGIEILCTMSSFLRVPDCFTSPTKDSAQQMTGTLAGTRVVYSPQPFCTHSALCAEVYSEKQNSSDSTATLQLWSLSSRLFRFPNLAASIKECRYDSIEEIHSTTTAKADLLKIICRMLGKTELLLESLY